jgi:hypothetical protein
MLLAGAYAEAALVARPFLAAVSHAGMWAAFQSARRANELGTVSPLTLTVWGLSWVFALSSYAAFARALRGLSGCEPRIVRVYAFAVAVAAVWMTLHLSRYGLIGLATWRW